jgi:purine-binding chemotaxis protein CheW
MTANQIPTTGTHTPDPDLAPRFRERVRQRSGTVELLVFAVAAERFAVELPAVEEVIEAPAVQPVPEAPPGLLGIFALRDRLLALYATTRVLGVAADSGGVALVIRSGTRHIGLAVDDAEDVMEVDLRDLRDPPSGTNEDEVVVGLLWRDRTLVTVLDARALAASCAHRVEEVT